MDILGLSLLPPPKIQPSERMPRTRTGASIGPRLRSAAHSPLSPLLFSRRYCNGKGFIHRVEGRGKGRNRIPIPNSTFAFVMQLPTAKPDTNRHRLAFFAADEAPMGGREEKKGLGVRLIYPFLRRETKGGVRHTRIPLPLLPSLRSVHSAFLPLCVCPLCGTTSMGKKERGRGEVDVAAAVAITADDDDGRPIWKERISLSALPFG